MKIKNLGVAAGVLGALLLTGCSQAATSPDMIAVVSGNGKDGNDAKVHEVVLPGQRVNIAMDENVVYFPGNSRNYVIDSRKAKEEVDRVTPSEGRTSEGTPVKVNLRAQWMVNQDQKIIADKFFPYCQKFVCASPDPAERGERSSTAGWVTMLNEDMAPAIDNAVREAMPNFDDTIWTEQKGWSELAASISDEFPASMSATTGYTDDLYCGSGDSSGWDSGTPGEGTFTCGPVRFTILSVEAANPAQQKSNTEADAATRQKVTNKAVREAAEEKYGSNAGEVLGQLDVIEKCAAAQANCTIILGGNSGLPVQVPAPSAPQE